MTVDTSDDLIVVLGNQERRIGTGQERRGINCTRRAGHSAGLLGEALVSGAEQSDIHTTSLPHTRRFGRGCIAMWCSCNERPVSCIVGVMTEARSANAGVPGQPGAAADVQRGELAALYDLERVPMIRLAALLVGSHAIAEEIVQDSFAALGERWGQLDNPGGYLRSTVVNGCRMALRRRATEQRYARDETSTVDAPTELVELREALDRLSERERAVVALRYFVDLPDGEIAELLGCRTTTVRSLVHRSLRKLRKELS